MIRRFLAASCLVLLNIFALSSPARAAPQTFNNALPVAEGEFVFREQLIYRKAGDDQGPADRDLTVRGAISVLGYGVTGNFAVFGVLPYLDKELKVTIPGGERFTRDTNGIADVRLFGRYTVYRHDAPGRTFRIAPFLGVELPTGNDDEGDNLGLLPPPLQPGSGSWDLLGGMVATRQTLDYEMDAQVSYKLNTEANNFEFGDETRLDASFQYRLWPRELSTGVPGFFYGVLEANLIHQEKNRTSGVKDHNSGGTSFFLSPGVQYAMRRWVLEAIVQLPVIQSFNGTALEDDYVVRTGFRVNF